MASRPRMPPPPPDCGSIQSRRRNNHDGQVPRRRRRTAGQVGCHPKAALRSVDESDKREIFGFWCPHDAWLLRCNFKHDTLLTCFQSACSRSQRPPLHFRQLFLDGRLQLAAGRLLDSRPVKGVACRSRVARLGGWALAWTAPPPGQRADSRSLWVDCAEA